MSNNGEERKREERKARFRAVIDSKAARKLRARKESERSLWFWLGMMGLVGWSVAVPTLVGVLIGSWIDKGRPGTVSWTLTFLLVGLVVGCLQAWYWIKKESSDE